MQLVTNLKNVNQILERVGYPMDGASNILMRLDPQDTCFAMVDLCQGFYQIPLARESKDLFSIVLLAGKFRYTCMPQGCSASSDFFKIFTDPEICNKVGYYKNVDDILTTTKDIGELEAKMKTLLKVGRACNLKLAL